MAADDGRRPHRTTNDYLRLALVGLGVGLLVSLVVGLIVGLLTDDIAGAIGQTVMYGMLGTAVAIALIAGGRASRDR